MPISVPGRIGAALSAAACVAAFATAAPQSAHAAPAYNTGLIAYGTGATPDWTTVDINTHQQHTITPTGGGFDPATTTVTQIKYSPDTRHVAFATSTGKLWVASADGTNANPITNTVNNHSPIAWTPDGTQILYSADGIQTIPANGSTPPKQLVAATDPSCGTEGPFRATDRNTVFFGQFCQPQGSSYVQASLFVHRPGDTAPHSVASYVDQSPYYAVSPDGSRIAQVSAWNYQMNLDVREVGWEDTRYLIMSKSASGAGPAVFGPSGDIAFAYQAWNENDIDVVADYPNAAPRTIVATPATDSTHPVSFLDWANGSSNTPARPIADRIGGTDRIATAINASQWAFDTRGTPGRQAATAVLTRDDLYPDALAGTALAIQKGGPLLLTHGSSLDAKVGIELARILSPGATVYLLGGPAALSPAIADTVQRLGYNPVRLGGADRYDTAVAIATAISGTNPKTILLATGTNFPDALTAGVAAGQERYSRGDYGTPAGGIVLLTDGAIMPPATLAYLNSLRPSQPSLYAIGGPADAAVRSIPWWPSHAGLVGSDRYDTAAKVAASALYGNGAPGRYTMAAITTGTNFPDAMSGGALAGSQDAPLLLAGPGGLSPAENTILHAGHLSDIAIIGGPAAVSNRILAAAADTAFGPHAWDTYTNRKAPPLR